MKRIVLALGGNALGQTPQEQIHLVKKTAKSIVDLVEEGYEIVVGHGKGVIFSGGEILKTVPEEKIADEIIKLAGEYDKNTGEFH